MDFTELQDRINEYFETLGWDLRIEISPEGILSYPEGLKWAISGRGPGGMPPIQPIQDWIDKHNLTLNPYAVARNISVNGVVSAFDWDEFYKYVQEWVEAYSDKIIDDSINAVLEKGV